MANDLNQCQFIGRLGKDPEQRFMSNGDAVASFSIAVGWKTKEKEGAEWVNITAFGKLAEICTQYLTKGSQVFIQGRMKTDEYEKDGIKLYSTKIVAEKLQMLGGKSDRPASDSADDGEKYAPKTPPASKKPEFDDEDSIPF
jgi:single-strand DNA-binding protein